MIHITVTGINEIVSLLQMNVNEMPTLNTDILNQIASDMTDEMRKNAHVITGRMKASIYQTQANSQYVEVGATAPYSVYENARAGTKAGFGTHDFATRAFLTVQGRAWNILTSAYNRLFRNTVNG